VRERMLRAARVILGTCRARGWNTSDIVNLEVAVARLERSLT
jgi:hypothetical protein